jgi:hypothetical protein
VTAGASDNWSTVSQFLSDLRNASRLATYVDTVINIYESGAWRHYTDASGRTDDWREYEFDYFLIASGAQYGDIQRLLSWDRARAADVASAMTSDDTKKRRSLEAASAAWRSPTSASLLDLAERQGWTKATGLLRVPPAPARARTRARLGVTMDEHARRQREAQISATRRKELDRRLRELANGLTPLELRYVRDGIAAKLAHTGGRPAVIDHEQLRRDIAEVGRDVGALADRWGTSRSTARKRLARAGT